MTDPQAYEAWSRRLRFAAPLTHHEYHVGNLAADRRLDPVLNKLAALLYALAELQYVVLYQKRDGHDMRYYVVPCYRPLEEKIDLATGERAKRADGTQIMVYGELSAFHSSRGFEHGCIAEAEALAGLFVVDMKKRKKRRNANAGT